MIFRRSPWTTALVAMLSVVLIVGWVALAVSRRHPGSAPSAGVAQPQLREVSWPVEGQAAVTVDSHHLLSSPGQTAVPIASVAKVMTAYLVLEARPLRTGEDGPTMTVSAEDVADTQVRRGQEESVISVAEGEELTERQALQAILIPSANNVAAMLATFVAGDEASFVAKMNSTARRLHMTHTYYTDPSGFEADTVSTATDQLRLALVAMKNPVFASIVAMRSASFPVAGTVRNTNTLLGRSGFVGIKTGSDDDAGGCFAFRATRSVHGAGVTITGVVLGQRSGRLIPAAMRAAAVLAEDVTQRLVTAS
ncbi:MAG: D-alanyl-D-alanine carboxypeptidase family protein [Jatrophihabitans sp.]